MRPTEHARTIPSPPPFLPPLLRAPGVVRTGVTAAAPSCQEIRLRCSSRFNGFNRRRFCGAVCLKTITALFPEATGVGYPFLLQWGCKSGRILIRPSGLQRQGGKIGQCDVTSRRGFLCCYVARVTTDWLTDRAAILAFICSARRMGARRCNPGCRGGRRPCRSRDLLLTYKQKYI